MESLEKPCLLCDMEAPDVMVRPSGYCAGCEEALDGTTPAECEEDPEVGLHVARLRRFRERREMFEAGGGTHGRQT